MKSRREKVAALLDSPNGGERAAARAALGRIVDREPKAGTQEWFDAVSEWHAEIQWAVQRLGTPGLTPEEVRTIRMLGKHRGTPWNRGADAFREVLHKLRRLTR